MAGAACGEEDDGRPADTGVGGSTGGSAGGSTVEDSGGDRPTTWAFEENIEGMDVRLRGQDACSRTDALGPYRLEGVPADAEVMLELTHPDDLGRLLLQCFSGAVDRTQNPQLTSTAHMRPVYAGVDGRFDAELTAIPAETPVSFAGAVACGVPPGTYEIDILGPPDNCHMIEGWPSVDHDVRIVVEADTHSIFNWVCEERPGQNVPIPN